MRFLGFSAVAGTMAPAALLFLVTGTLAFPAFAQEPLETETARLPARGAWELSALFENQTSSTGKETALPFALEYGINTRLELLVEPILHTGIHPRFGRSASGPGDLEVTLISLLRPERYRAPALAFGAEIKFPTANNPLIGTGKADYAGYLIASQRYGKLDAHFNLGYTVIGQSVPGMHLNNLWFAGFAGDYHLSHRFDLVGEVFGNTSASPEAADSNGFTGNPVSTEVAGGEIVGMLGTRYRYRTNQTAFIAISHDNNGANLIRSGITVRL